jgi:hypothetical protein
MKILIHAVQSSGASLFAYWLSQDKNTIGIIDLYSGETASDVDYENVILKTTTNSKVDFEQHLIKYKPDLIIAFTRNPIENMIRLSEKAYGSRYGTPEEKIHLMDQFIQSGKCNMIIKYEDFILKKNLGIGNQDFYQFNRSIHDVVNFNCVKNKWCHDNHKKKWGAGNIHANHINFLNVKCDNLKNLY